MSNYTIHCSLDISGALRRPSYWRKALRINGEILSTEAFRGFLLDESRKGRIVIPLGCPTPNPDGTCPTHPCEEEKAGT